MTDSPLPEPGAYLKSYDPEAHEGSGWATWTTDPSEALIFPDIRAATETWRAQSITSPLRPDGKPNRPLTAFSVRMEHVPSSGTTIILKGSLP